MTERSDFPHVQEWQHDMIDKYGTVLNNTGGNDPRNLLERFATEPRLASSNIVVFTLACSIRSQLQLLLVLEEKGILPSSRGGP